MMQYTNNELTGNPISKIGLGCVTFGREIDKKASFAMMDHALSSGINLFDTASAYGSGASEIIMGEWMASRHPGSESVFTATKILPPYDQENMFKSVSNSLKHLRTNTLDLLYLHRWDPALEKP